MVRPPFWLPLPMVEEAVAKRPEVKPIRVEVALAVGVAAHAVLVVKGKAKPPVPHALPMLVNLPAASNWAQPVAPPFAESVKKPLVSMVRALLVEVALPF